MGVKGFGRITNWISLDNFTAPAINNEFNNLFTNLGAPSLSGASGDPATLSGMQALLNPGAVGSENLPATVQDEIRELRYMLNEIIGGAQWYSPVPINLTDVNSQLTGLFFRGQNRIISGAVDVFGQPAYLLPTASANGIDFLATATTFRCYINGTISEFTADVSAGPLSIAPATQNTCIVNDATLSGQQSSETKGERSTILQIKTLGTNISAKVGSFAAFSVNGEPFIGQVVNGTSSFTGCTFGASFSFALTLTAHGLNDGDQIIPTSISGFGPVISNGTTYYAQVLDANNVYLLDAPNGVVQQVPSTITATIETPKQKCLQNCYRGFFTDSTGASIQRVPVSNGDTITLLELSWVFISASGSLLVVYNEPVVSANQPTAANIGDFWLNLVTGQWNQYNGASWVVSNAVMIGYSAQNTTVTVGTRSVDFDNAYAALNTVTGYYGDASTVCSVTNPQASVYGNNINLFSSLPKWSTISDLDVGISLTQNTTYYCYLSNKGEFFVSSTAPYNRVPDLIGYYHPYKPYRCVSQFSTNTGDTNINPLSVVYQDFYQSLLPDGAVGIHQLRTNAVGTQQIVNLSVTPKKLSPIIVVASAPSDATPITNTSPTLVPNLQLTGIPVFGGRGVEILLDGADDNAAFIRYEDNGTQSRCEIRLVLGVSVYRYWGVQTYGATATLIGNMIIPNSIRTFYIPPTDGLASFSIEANMLSGGNVVFENVILVVRSL